jgi:hypothetical protein
MDLHQGQEHFYAGDSTTILLFWGFTEKTTGCLSFCLIFFALTVKRRLGLKFNVVEYSMLRYMKYTSQVFRDQWALMHNQFHKPEQLHLFIRPGHAILKLLESITKSHLNIRRPFLGGQRVHSRWWLISKPLLREPVSGKILKIDSGEGGTHQVFKYICHHATGACKNWIRR